MPEYAAYYFIALLLREWHRRHQMDALYAKLPRIRPLVMELRAINEQTEALVSEKKWAEAKELFRRFDEVNAEIQRIKQEGA